MSAPDAKAFLKRVVPWPVNGGPGFINAHYRGPRFSGMGGRPFTDLDQFIGYAITWGNANPSWVTDMYFCLSLQAQTGGVGANGRVKAARSREAALSLNAIWLDVDGYKDYADKPSALKAIMDFIKRASLPPPTALVDSGGGWHVYWISNKTLSLGEWQPYAQGLWELVQKHGLKADPVTTDAARILRVPGTFNHKQLPPRPVVLRALAPADIDFAALMPQGAPVTVAVTARPLATKPLLFDPTEFTQQTPVTDDLAPDCRHELLIDPRSVIKGCPHFTDAFRAGGSSHNQGLWMQTVLASTWFPEGRKFAHAFSKGYPTYDSVETDKMYDRKENDRYEKELGWPLCTTFEREGCTLCATCIHKGKIKSPLNLGLPAARPDLDGIIGQVKEAKINPVAALMTLRDQGADIKQLLAAMNQTYAAVKYGGQILVVTVIGNDIEFMKTDDFHKMFANLVVYEDVNESRRGAPKKHAVRVSRRWFEWKDRRQYFGRGVVFEPGGLPETPNDMLNLWRGFGVTPTLGDWSKMRRHLLDVVCSGHQKHFHYLIRWMAYAVQHPDKPIGVAVAFLGAQGAGKGIVARTFGEFFGKHFTHIANGEQLIGRFNASLGASCAVFLDEALWAGDRKGEGVLKALITEPSFQLEAKFRDPIMVENRLRIIVASNSDWAVPTGIGDRRWFVLNIANTYAGTGHRDYWSALYKEIKNGGAAAMLHDLLAMDLREFDVRAVPNTVAKAHQQTLGLHGTEAWLYHVLQEGRIGYELWQKSGLAVRTDHAYSCYEDFSKRQHAWRPELKPVWSKKIRAVLGQCVVDTRQTIGNERARSFRFASLADCRGQFAGHIVAPDLEWEPDDEPKSMPGAAVGQTAEKAGGPTELRALHDAPSIEWEPDLEPDNWLEYDPADECE